MNTINVNATQSAAAGIPSATTGSTTPGSDVFMEILLAQLRHQNPLEPLKDSEMIAQFSQLNSLQALVNMKDMMAEIASIGKVDYGASLVGRQVRAARSDGTIIEGKVDSVGFEAGKVVMKIGPEKLPLENLLEVVSQDA